MELLTDKLNKLISSVGTQSTDAERADVAERLRLLIIAYGKVQAVAAIQMEHKVFQAMGLVAVDKDALATLNQKMATLTSQSGDALADSDVEWLNAGLLAQSHYLQPANDATIDFEGRTFRVADPDLQALMDDTEALLSPGGANQDVGMSWSESLQRVLKRLQAEKEQRVEIDNASSREYVDKDHIRGRLHKVIGKVLGLNWLDRFKTNGTQLAEGSLNAHQSSVFASLCETLEAEFEGLILTEDSRAELFSKTSDELVELFYNWEKANSKRRLSGFTVAGLQRQGTEVLDWPHAPGRDGAQDAPPKPDDDFDEDDEEGEEAARQLWLRYRVTLVMSKTLGRVIALHFKTDKVKLVEILGRHDTDKAEGLFKAFETEFHCRISDSDRGALIEMTNIEMAQYFGERIKDAKAK